MAVKDTDRLAELESELAGFDAEEAAAQAETERRAAVKRERDSLVDQAAAEERDRQRAAVVEAAGAIRAAQLKSLAKAGRLFAQLERLWREELVPQARDLTALRAGSEALFDSRAEFVAATREPVQPFPPDAASLAARVGEVACSQMIRRSRLASDEWLDAVPDLTSSPREVALSGVEGLPSRLSF